MKGVIIPPNSLQIIEKEVGPQIRAKFVSIVKRGYDLANQAKLSHAIFNWEIGEKHLGYLRHIAVQYAFKMEIDRRRLPFQYEVQKTRNNTYEYLQINTQSAVITISQVKNERDIARPAFFREKLQEVNQIRLNLFGDADDIVKEKPYYLLLTHGYGKDQPYFVNLGMPYEKGWIDKINLLREPHLVVDRNEVSKEEKITEVDLVGLKEFVQEVEGNDRV